jgi:hypothetical protein
MKQCTQCGSYAINPRLYDRDGTDNDLCDVCYWKKRAQPSHDVLVTIEALRTAIIDQMVRVQEAWVQARGTSGTGEKLEYHLQEYTILMDRINELAQFATHGISRPTSDAQ